MHEFPISYSHTEWYLLISLFGAREYKHAQLTLIGFIPEVAVKNHLIKKYFLDNEIKMELYLTVVQILLTAKYTAVLYSAVLHCSVIFSRVTLAQMKAAGFRICYPPGGSKWIISVGDYVDN